jgi:hypothetical protein
LAILSASVEMTKNQINKVFRGKQEAAELKDVFDAIVILHNRLVKIEKIVLWPYFLYHKIKAKIKPSITMPGQIKSAPGQTNEAEKVVNG